MQIVAYLEMELFEYLLVVSYWFYCDHCTARVVSPRLHVESGASWRLALRSMPSSGLQAGTWSSLANNWSMVKRSQKISQCASYWVLPGSTLLVNACCIDVHCRESQSPGVDLCARRTSTSRSGAIWLGCYVTVELLILFCKNGSRSAIKWIVLVFHHQRVSAFRINKVRRSIWPTKAVNGCRLVAKTFLSFLKDAAIVFTHSFRAWLFWMIGILSPMALRPRDLIVRLAKVSEGSRWVEQGGAKGKHSSSKFLCSSSPRIHTASYLISASLFAVRNSLVVPLLLSRFTAQTIQVGVFGMTFLQAVAVFSVSGNRQSYLSVGVRPLGRAWMNQTWSCGIV